MNYPFFVKKGGRIYEIGETFEGTERKVAQLVARGLATALEVEDPGPGVPEPDAPGADDLSTLTNNQLKELCAARGIEVPRKATKPQLLRLLEA